MANHCFEITINEMKKKINIEPKNEMRQVRSVAKAITIILTIHFGLFSLVFSFFVVYLQMNAWMSNGEMAKKSEKLLFRCHEMRAFKNCFRIYLVSITEFRSIIKIDEILNAIFLAVFISMNSFFLVRSAKLERWNER